MANMIDQTIQQSDSSTTLHSDMDAPNKNLSTEAQEILARLQQRTSSSIMNFETLRLVRTLWPEIFSVSHPRPLKVGIHKDMIAASGIPEEFISQALHFFTSTEKYLECIKAGAIRIDLDGMPAGKVKLREAVDSEIKMYQQSSDYSVTRYTTIIKQVRVLSIKKMDEK